MLLPTIIFLAAVHLSAATLDEFGGAANDCFVYDTSIGHGKQGNGAGNGAGTKNDVPTAFACQEECQNTEACNVWIWNEPEHKKHPNVCWMKKAATEPRHTKRDVHRISGPKVCDCFAHDASIRKVGGNGAGRVDDVSCALECQMRCQMTDECNAFIWNDAEHKKHPNVCWMKKGFTEKGMSFGRKRDIHRHSGPKFCGPMEDTTFA
jgi:hypothetical protein